MMRHLRKRLLRAAAVAVGLVVAGMATGGPSAAAPVTLQYTGNNFTFASGAYTTSMSVTGWVTLPTPLGINETVFYASQPASLTSVDVDAFSFSDGIQTVTELNSTAWGFLFNTNSDGDIVGSRVDIQNFNLPNSFTIIACSNPSGPTSTGLCGDRGGAGASEATNLTNPGTWTVVPAIPLPSAFPLFGTGLGILGFLGWRRRRKAQAVLPLIGQ